MEVAIDSIKPSPYQPRITFNIEDLKREIANGGILSELIVRERDTHYELVDGERRLRVLKELGWKTVPVQVIHVDDREARRRVFRLNRHRRNYSAEEEARFFKKLAEEGMSSYEIAQDLGIDDTWVRANLNIFKFPGHIQESIWVGSLFPTHIRQLEPIIKADSKRAIELAEQCKEQSLTTDDLAKLLKPELAALEEARLKAAQEKLGDAAPNVVLETPERLEEAAEALKREAKRQREEALPPEAREAEEQARLERKLRLAEEKKQREKAERRRQEEKIRQETLNQAFSNPELLKIAIERAETVLPADEVRVAIDYPTSLSDKHLAEVFKAPPETWTDLIKASEKRGWTPLELAAVVDAIKDENTTHEYKAQLLQGEADPVVSKGDEPAILEDTLKRRMGEALEQDKMVSLTRVWDALSKLQLFDSKEIVDALDNFHLERVVKDTPRDIEYLSRLLALARERLEFWQEVDR